MKQPDNSLDLFVDGDYIWVDVESSDGDLSRGAISIAKSENMAWKKAIKRLEKLTNYAKKKYEEAL